MPLLALATALSLVLLAICAAGSARGALAQPSPTPVVLTDGIAAGVVRGDAGFGTSSLIVPAGMTVTYFVQTDPALAGGILSIWTRGQGDAWARVTSRSVATDGTVHYFAPVVGWTAIQARFAGSATFAPAQSHGRIAVGSATAVSVWPPVKGPMTVAVHGSAVPYYHGPRDQHVVALTFDDGYSGTATSAILRILLADHVAATFFPYGRAALANAAAWRAVGAAGYPVGDHTLSHPNLTLLDRDDVESQLREGRADIQLATGSSIVPLMRPPYGAWNASTAAAIAAAGFPTMVLWDVDTRDWSGIGPAAIAAAAEAGINGSIVLMHAGPANTPLALPAIISSYRARGFRFVTVPELMELP